MSPLFEWLGGKVRHAQLFGDKIIYHLPKDGVYYEGFAGAATVAIYVGNKRPDAKIILTDTNPCLINALHYVQQNKPLVPILQTMQRLAESIHIEQRRQLCEAMFYSPDPVKWLAAVNSIRPTPNAWPYPPEKIVARACLLPQIWQSCVQGLEKAIIKCQPMSYNNADVVYFDPPYYSSTFEYYAQQGDTVQWLPEMSKFQRTAKYILISDNLKAFKAYEIMKFKTHRSGRKLNSGVKQINVKDEDGYYEWSVEHTQTRLVSS